MQKYKGEIFMKKIGILIIFVLLMAAITTAHAENKEGSFYLTPSVGGYFFEGNQDYKDNITLGLRAGYNFTEHFGTEFFCNLLESKFEDTDGVNRVYVAGIEGLYHFIPRGSFVPFLAIGIGAIHYTSGDPELQPSKFAVDYGAGVNFFITDDIAMRADVRHVLPLGNSSKYGDNPNDIHNDLLVTLGITFAFGGKKAIE